MLLLLATDQRRHILLLTAVGIGQMTSAIAVMSGIRTLFEQLIASAGSAVTGTAQPPALLLITAGFLTLAWLRAYERSAAERLGQNHIASLRLRLFDQLCRMPADKAGKLSRGSLLMRFTGDLNAVRTWVSLGIARLLVSGVFTVTTLLWLASISPAIAATTALSTAAGFAAAWYLGGKLRLRAREARSRRSTLISNIAEKSTTLSVVQVFAQQQREKQRLKRQSDALVNAMIGRADVIGQLRGVSEITIGLVMLSLLYLGSYEIDQGRLETTQLAAIMGLLILLAPSLRSLGRINEYWHAARVSNEKIEAFLQRKEQPQGRGGLSGPLRRKGAVITFEKVKLHNRLNEISGTVAAGEKLAVTGPNGAGKSSLIQLIVRLLDPSSGRITIAGRPMAKLGLRQLRRQVSIAAPGLPLLRGSIRRNLLYRNSRADEAELQRVIELCQLGSWLASLPKGLDTQLTENGGNLSQGEQQRLMLARALVGSPPILLLDEPELNADPKTRRLFQRIIGDYLGTVILITHDAQFASLADQVWYLEQGSIVERGAADFVLNSSSFSAPFFNQGRAA